MACRKTRVIYQRPRPSHWSGRARIDGIRWEWEGSAQDLSHSSAYDKPEQVCGRTVTVVTVRPQQMLMNTRAKRRTTASRQPVLYAGVRPPDCRPGADTRRCPGGASRGTTPRSQGVSASAPASFPRCLHRRTVQVTKVGTASRRGTDLERVLRARFQLVDHHRAMALSSQSVHSSSSVAGYDRSS